MEGLNLTPGLAALECVLILMAILSGSVAFFLIRSARRDLHIKRKRPAYLPSTPLTREKPKRTREVARV